jgi:hypothetical protein
MPTDTSANVRSPPTCRPLNCGHRHNPAVGMMPEVAPPFSSEWSAHEGMWEKWAVPIGSTASTMKDSGFVGVCQLQRYSSQGPRLERLLGIGALCG